MHTGCVVLGNIANLYSEPNQAVELVTQAILGTELSILEGEDGWYYVQMPDQYRGWIEAAHVRIYTPGEAPYLSTDRVVQVSNLFACLYHEPSASARAPALQVTIGARLEVVEEQEGWVKVVLPDGAVRWVQAGDVVVVEPGTPSSRGSVEKLIATARRFLGLPYLWGGTTPQGIDCSAFVQLVYHLNGVSLLRDSHIQYTQADLTPVDKEDLRAGDLIFFGQTAITHVGLYMGNGEFIHSTTHKQPIVQISRLDEAHWTGLYQGARRP
jgi:cell wall-associated NlpC family hydrolase